MTRTTRGAAEARKAAGIGGRVWGGRGTSATNTRFTLSPTQPSGKQRQRHIEGIIFLRGVQSRLPGIDASGDSSSASRDEQSWLVGARHHSLHVTADLHLSQQA
ncbi:hypothetical protein E2C01_074727 [Portunus trituberculatus]|uniref:Uncharacterized protein n=1 Tax=Portunus trituberculatus TaxID=210409 RepID=A0A5B7IF16_PORTR|nr:hypothetical protein [Portunus trituberculatus]